MIVSQIYLQGILGVLAGLLGNQFFVECYTPLGEVMDMLALINCMVNFILYCTMSRQFRITFSKIFNLWKIVTCLRNTFTENTESPVDDLLVENYLMVSKAVT